MSFDIDFAIDSFIDYLKYISFFAITLKKDIGIIERNIKNHEWKDSSSVLSYGKNFHLIRCDICGITVIILEEWDKLDKYLFEEEFIDTYVKNILIKNSEMTCNEYLIEGIIK